MAQRPLPSVSSPATPRSIAIGRNKATHFVGIPLIVFSLLLILSLWRSSSRRPRWFRWRWWWPIVAVLGWMALDLGIGLVMAA